MMRPAMAGDFDDPISARGKNVGRESFVSEVSGVAVGVVDG